MSVSWTQDQEKAITHKGRGIVVSAAAGSGKTAVLIERVIRLLCDKENKIPADKLLAVTFTNDAAAQMRDKLNAALDKKISQEPDNKWLLQQQSLVQLARISTIDSFCLDLVKENLNEFEFQGGLTILEQTQRDIIFSNAYEQAMEQLCRDRRDDYDFLLNAMGSQANVSQCVLELTRHLSTICHRDKWIEKTIKSHESADMQAKCIEMKFDKAQELVDKLDMKLDRLRYWYNYGIAVGEKNYLLSDSLPALVKNLEICTDMVSDLSLMVKHRQAEKITDYQMPKIKSMRLSSKLPEDIAAMLDDARKMAAATIKAIKEGCTAVQKLFSCSIEHYKDNMRTAGRIFSILCDVQKRTEQLQYELKLEKNAVDFNDIELMTKNLLVRETENGFERTELAQEISSSGMYKIIMIDEFQDVNDLQEIIFRAISDTDNLDIMGKNTFIVGDVKQAIYKFRQTNPALFKRCISQSKDNKYAHSLEHIALRKNFRSRREVIGVSNYIFRNVMSSLCGEVDYDEEQSLEAGAAYTERKCPAQVLFVQQPDGDQTKKNYGFSLEQLETARRIRQMLDEKTPVCDGGEDRPCRPSDFCVLVSRNAAVTETARALEMFSLKAYSEDTDGYIKSREITIALNLLRVVDNPMNDMALSAVMMSPVLSFTPDEMALIRQKCRVKNSSKLSHIYQILSGTVRDRAENYGRYTQFDNTLLQQKCAAAFKLVESLRYNSMSMSLERLIRKIFDETDLMGITSLYLDSDKKRANLRLLLEYASSYEQNGKDGITGFLHFIDCASKDNAAFKNAVTVTSDGDCVNVKTYHKSKGLEYPFVFLCSLDMSITKGGTGKKSICLHNEYGGSVSFSDSRLNVERDNLYFDYLDSLSQNELKSERMRIFYVGCTRAREKLIFVCAFHKASNVRIQTVKEKLREAVRGLYGCESIPAQLVRSCDSLLYWLVFALARHKNRKELEMWLEMDLSPIPIDKTSAEADIEYRFTDYTQGCLQTQQEPSEQQTQASFDPLKVRELCQRYAFEYNRENSLLPAKLSVTEIVQEEKEKRLSGKNPEFYPNLPRLDEELDKLSAAEKGTFTHKFMQLADYGRARLGVREELDRLVKEGFFTPKEADGVYVDKLEGFVHSPFFERMLASDDLRREQKFLAAVRDLNLPQSLMSVTGGDGMIQGIADCIFKEKDGWVLVDYKTDNFQSPEEMTQYGTQLALYKAAFELVFGERVKSSYIYSLKLGVGMEFNI